MKKTLLLAIGLTLIFLSCKKDNNDETTLGGAFPKTIVEETIGSIGTVKTTETYTLSDNKITAFERKVVDNGTPTTDEVYTITYNGNNLQSIVRNDNAQKISYEYANGKISKKTTESGSEINKYSYTYDKNKITMIAHSSFAGFNDYYIYSLNPDGTVASLEKATYVGAVPDQNTKGTCTYQYDNKPNIYQRDLFKYLAEIELISNYNYYGDYYRDPLIRTAAHNVVSYTKNLHNNTQADYKDLENATRTFSYQWNSNNTPKSAEYKKNNAHKATYTYTY